MVQQLPTCGSSKVDISIVIVTWNSERYLGKCLNALQQQGGQDFELIIVDNASEDGTVALVETLCPEALLIKNNDNLGFARACNQGIEVADGEWIGTLNPDTEVEPDWLKCVRVAMQGTQADVGMVQCKMYFSGTRRINSTGIELTRTAGARDRSFRKFDSPSEDPVDVFCPTAGAAFYRKRMLDQVALETGYFDQGFFMYWEDVDLGWRCRLCGWKAMYEACAVVFHDYQGATCEKEPEFARSLIQRNRVSSIFKNGSPSLIVMSMPRTIYLLVRSVLLGHFGAVRDVFRAARYGSRQRQAVAQRAVIPQSKIEREWFR